MPVDKNLIDFLAGVITDDPDILRGITHNKSAKRKPGPKPLTNSVKPDKGTSNNDGLLSESVATNLCRNRVYRRGTVKRCGRISDNIYCEGCQEALEEQNSRLLGLIEDKEPSNPPGSFEIDDKFDTQCDDDDCDNHEPKDPKNRSSSLTDGPNGAKQTGSAYLK